jgi:catechol 2,3-dioxygenase-like lactoylglutathione lyase family enzyme
MAPRIEKVSAVTFRVVNMTESVRFYRDVLGMELVYGGEDAGFSSLRAKDTQSAILNLEQSDTVTRWGRLVFHVTDVDALWNHLKDRGFDPEIPRDASWGNAISTCPIRTATSCRLRVRYHDSRRITVSGPAKMIVTQLIASFLARTLGDGSQGELRAGIYRPDFPCGSGAVAEL